jgi:GxxExxY protein
VQDRTFAKPLRTWWALRLNKKKATQRFEKKYLCNKKNIMTENEIATKIVNCALTVHKALGPGLLKNAYQECLFYKLTKEGLFVEKEKPMPIIFEDVIIDCGYRIDLLVENKVIIKNESVVELNDVHLAQIIAYLKLGNYKLGMLINFNVALIKNGIRRVANGM